MRFPVPNCLVLIGILLTSSVVCDAGRDPDVNQIAKRPALPMVFVRLKSENADGTRLIGKSATVTGSFGPRAIVLHARDARVSLTFPGANLKSNIETLDELDGKVNLLIGSDPSSWKASLTCFARVAYRQLYPGIDMIYGGTERILKSEYIVAPGADASVIRIRYSGANRLTADAHGNLRIQAGAGEFLEAAPYVYQNVDHKRRPVRTNYLMLDKNTVAFEIGKYDGSKELIIDPSLTYSTYLGGNGSESATSIAVDAAGNSYIAGYTDSSDFPQSGALQGSRSGVDAFVVKLSASGKALIYATYLGGVGDDRAFGIAVDPSGNAIITGYTTSANFPSVSAYQRSLAGDKDAFVTKLNASGSAVIYSTFLGGSGADIGNAVVLDGAGNVHIAGSTASTNFPMIGGAQTTNHGSLDCFLAVLLPSGQLSYSTYLGGSGDDICTAIATDVNGSNYLTGSTTSPDFPVANAFQPGNAGGQDAFVARIAGSQIVYSSYLGGSGGLVGQPESGRGIVADASGNVYITGVTPSLNFPSHAAFQATHGGGRLDAFLVKVNSSGTAIVYSTFFGGVGDDTATSIVLDLGGSPIIAGMTFSVDLPMVLPIQSSFQGPYDGFVAKFSPDGSQVYFSTYFGGNGSDGTNAIATNGSGDVWIAGQTSSSDLPVVSAYQSFPPAQPNAFVARLNIQGTGSPPPCTYTMNPPTIPLAPAAGGSGALSVSAPGYCSWTSVGNDAWITTSPGGTGNGSVNYSIASNGSTSPRSGTMNVAGQNFQVNQSGACNYSVSASPYAAPASASASSFGVTTTCSWTAVSNDSFITVTSATPGNGSGTVGFSVATNTGAARLGTITAGTATFSVYQSATPTPTNLRFVPMNPCRVVDTRAGRGTSGAFGPPAMSGGTRRDFPLPVSSCGIPSEAKAYSLTVSVAPSGTLGYLSVWPAGQSQPFVSTLNSLSGDSVANAAIVPAGTNGSISVYVSNTTDVMIDINGYFAAADFAPPAFGSNVLFPVTPCRAVDTRAGQGTRGALGPPVMGAGTKRDFPLPLSSCGIPSAAKAYSVNITVVPSGPLAYLSAWPTGFPQSASTTLNSVRGKVLANAAVVAAGSGGSISVNVSDTTDVIVDINGYFADPTFVPANGTQGLLFNAAIPCRVVDTRAGQGTSGAFGPPSLVAGAIRDFPISSSACGIPGAAQAYSLNATVVPPGSLGYLTAWPSSLTQPFVSTLNSIDGSVVANAAIVPAGSNGAISLYVSNRTDLILDINGYFAP